MTRLKWIKRITAAATEAGTYKPCFDDIIATLADILAKRDEAQAIWKKDGSRVVVPRTNRSGAENLEQHPVLRMINDLNRDALAYWRDLGLTPAGLRRINDAALARPEATDPLADMLSQIKLVDAM